MIHEMGGDIIVGISTVGAVLVDHILTRLETRKQAKAVKTALIKHGEDVDKKLSAIQTIAQSNASKLADIYD